MSAPFVPNDFKLLISDPSSTMCGNMTATLLRLPILLYKLVLYLFDASGNPTKAFVNSTNPTGSLMFSACALPEDGTRLLCDGRALAQADFPDLYAAIGATYAGGSPPGAGQFRLPDFRAKFPVGMGSGGTASFDDAGAGSVSLGVAGGADQKVLAVTNLPSHSHFLFNGTTVVVGSQPVSPTNTATSVASNAGGTTADYLIQGAAAVATMGKSSIVGSDTPTPVVTIPPFLGVFTYIIC